MARIALETLEEFFKNINVAESVILIKSTTILNVATFSKTHLQALKSNPNNKLMLPYCKV